MKYYIYSLLILLIHAEFLNAQNLVLNPSFEDTIGCPLGLNGTNKLKYWNIYRSTPDYYHRCAPFENSVPNNSNGYQEPFNINENAYCGLITYLDFFEYREFLGSQLKQSLVIGKKYFVSMKVSLANSSKEATNNIGIKLLTTPYSDTGNLSPSPQLITNYAQIFSQSVILDTIGWQTISGSFIADSDYDYISIGNFFNDSMTNHVHLGTINGAAYYYVDDVCVSEDSLMCDSDTGLSNQLFDTKLQIYPNPTNKEIIISSHSNIIYKLSLINLYGAMIKKISIHESGVLDVSEVQTGVYVVEIKFQDKIIRKKQLIIH